MSTIAKTVVATGASSGIGFELVRQLLGQAQPYRFILGARDTEGARKAYSQLQFDNDKHSLTVLPLELSDLRTVRTFAQQALEKLGNDKLDYLLLNAAISNGTEQPAPGPNGSKWSEPYIVNHLSQHYLVHLLQEKLVTSRSRLVFVSSGVIRNVPDPSVLEVALKAGSGEASFPTYCGTKFTALLGAHWWRRQLTGVCDVVAVSPGLIPNTGLGRGMKELPVMPLPDAKSIPEGAQNILRAFTQDDFPEDPDQILLTSWGEWWSKDLYSNSLDKGLQDKWSPSKEEIEKEELTV